MKHTYGIQLYSVRDITEKNFPLALEQVAALGYKEVEFAGFFGYSAEKIKEMLDKNELAVSGTHTGWDELTPENIEKTVEYHKVIGNHNIIVPGADLNTLEKIEKFCEVMNFAQPILNKEGISLAFHNHSREFELQTWGSTIHSELEKRTDIDFEIDTFWAFNAGCDPIGVMDRLKDRIKVIHLKDGFKGGIGKPLGQGEAPIKEIRDYAYEHGFTVVVESETLTPDGMTEAKECIEFLKTID